MSQGINTNTGIEIPQMEYSHSQSASGAMTQLNSQVAATGGNVTMTSGKDTQLLGANVKGQTVDLNAGGKVVLESRQDNEISSADSYSLSLGQNIGFSLSHSESKSNWTNSPSSIIGTDRVNVTAKELNMVGSVIANKKDDGTDGGNLKVAVDKLVASDLKNSQESNSYSFNVGTTLGIQASGEKVSMDWKDGTTTAGFSNSDQNKEGLSHATIGQGEITAASIPDRLNRDITKSEEITKNEKTGGFNTSLNVDNRWVAGGERQKLDANGKPMVDAEGKPIMESTTAWEEIKSDLTALKELPTNLPKAIENMGKGVEGAGENAIKTAVAIAGEEELKLPDVGSVFTTMENSRVDAVKDTEKTQTLEQNIKKVLENSGSREEMEDALSQYIVDGKEVKGVKLTKDPTQKGALIGKDGIMYINLDGVEAVNLTDTQNLVEVMTHEKEHTRQQTPTTQAMIDRNQSYANAAASGAGTELKWQDLNVEDIGKQKEWVSQKDSGEFTQNNEAAKKTESPQYLFDPITVVVGGIIGAGLDYGTQAVINHYGEKKLTWKESFELANIDGKSIAFSGALGASSVGLGQVIEKTVDAYKLGKTALLIGEVGIDAGTSIAGQRQKDENGKIDNKYLSIDIFTGRLGKGVSELMGGEVFQKTATSSISSGVLSESGKKLLDFMEKNKNDR